jgi:Seryl-tRNA synthetase
MLDLSYLKGEKLEKLKNSLVNRGYSLDILEKVLKIDERRRKIIKEVDNLRAKKNEKSKIISQMRAKGENVDDLLKEAKEIDNVLENLEEERKKIENEFHYYWSLIPNIPHESVPIGKDSSENVVVREWGRFQNLTLSQNHIGKYVKNLIS